MTEFPEGTLLAGRLKVVRQLGAGGVGAVYEIEHQVTRHRRALKVLHPKFRAMPEVVERFLREGSAAGRIGNPHIVEAFDAGELENGAPWLLMELLSGEPLSEVLRRAGRLDFGPACALLSEVALALQAAHDAGIVHRDLKPDNLYVIERDWRPFVKVLDFGMSKFDSWVTGAVSMTAEGTTLGTPLYMAPEQMRGAKDVDGRADVYALGVILYEAIAGGVPYNAASFAELAVLVLGGAAPRLEALRPDAPPGLADVVHRAIAIDPAQRYRTARELAEALAGFTRLPASDPDWWRKNAEAPSSPSAPRVTSLGSDYTLPRTPSPMPSAPRPPPPVPSAPRATGGAHPTPPRSRPTSPDAPPQRAPPSSGFRRAPSLMRRFKQLGVVLSLALAGVVSVQLMSGGSSELPAAGIVAPHRVAGTDSRPELELEVLPRAPPPTPAEETVASAESTAKAELPLPRPLAKPTREPLAGCCQFTPAQLAQAAERGQVVLRGPQAANAVRVAGLPKLLKKKLKLEPATLGKVVRIFNASIARTHAGLFGLTEGLKTGTAKTADNHQLVVAIRSAAGQDLVAAARQRSKELADRVVKVRTSDDSASLKMLDLLIREDQRAIDELEEEVGAQTTQQVLGLFPGRVFPSDPRVERNGAQ